MMQTFAVTRLRDSKSKEIVARDHYSACRKAFSPGRSAHWRESGEYPAEVHVLAADGSEQSFYSEDNG